MVKKLFKQMVATQIVSAMAIMICMLIDSIMIGRFLGVDAMAAYGLATPILLLFSAIGSMMSAGIQVMCGKTIGNSDEAGTNRCFSIAVSSAVVISVSGVILVYIFMNPVCRLLGGYEGTVVFNMTAAYLKGFLLGAPAFILAQICVPFMQLSGRRRNVIVAVICMSVCNITFNCLNVFVFQKGTLGMGIASALSYYVAITAALPYFLRKDCIYKFYLKGLSMKDFRELTSGGVPTIVNQIAFTFLVLILNNMLLSYGDNEAVAAYSVVSNAANISYCIGGGIAAVSLMLSSIFYSDEDRSSIHSLIRVQISYAVIMDAVVAVLLIIFAPEIARLFLDDELEAIRYAVDGVRLFSLCLVFSALNTAFKNYYQGIGRVKLTEAISVLQNLIFPTFFAVLFGLLFGVNGIWFNFLLGEMSAFAFITIYTCIRTHCKKPCIESYAYLDDDFDRNIGDYIERKIEQPQDIDAAVKSVEEFCKSKNTPDDVCNRISICVKEATGNILRHGFEEGKDNLIEVRVAEAEGEWKLRIKDNCKPFDPVGYFAGAKPASAATPDKKNDGTVKEETVKDDAADKPAATPITLAPKAGAKSHVKMKPEDKAAAKARSRAEAQYERKKRAEERKRKSAARVGRKQAKQKGMELIFGNSSNVTYVTSLGLNILLIDI